MARFITKNNAASTLAVGVTAADTVLVLTPGGGARFPQPGNDEWFSATISDAVTGQIRENVRVTAVAGDVLTVVRAQEGTLAVPWVKDSRVEHLWTSEQAEEVVQRGELQGQAANYAIDSGAANAVVAAFEPPLAAPSPGTPLRVKIAANNSGPTTADLGWGLVPVRRRNGSELIGGELVAGDIAEFKWNGSLLLLQGLQPAPQAVVEAQEDEHSAVVPKYLGFAMKSFAALAATCIIAFGTNGQYQQSLPVITKELKAIRTIFPTGDGSWSLRLVTRPAVVPTSLDVRVDCGIDGETYGEHPAAGTWPVDPGPDPFTFRLVGSVYKPNCVFGGGHCWDTGAVKIDCSAEWLRLSAWARDHGPSKMSIPLGGMWVQNHMLRVPESCHLFGWGGKRSFICMADAADQPPGLVGHVIGTGGGDTDDDTGSFWPNVTDVHWEGFTVYGNRARSTYRRGFHAVDLGGDQDTSVPLNIRWRDVHVIGSAGYGSSGGGRNIKMFCYFHESSWVGCDGDSFDWKDRNLQNDIIYFGVCHFAWQALGDIGTNLQPLQTLAPDSIKTFAGESYVGIPITYLPPTYGPDLRRARIGEKFTIASGVAFNGITPNGSFNIIGGLAAEVVQTGTLNVGDATVTGLSSTTDIKPGYAVGGTGIPASTYVHAILSATSVQLTKAPTVAGTPTLTFDAPMLQIDTGQVATATGWGGGSTMTAFNPNLSVGDRLVDMRGERFTIRDCTYLGWMFGRNGFEQREAGTRCVVSNVSGYDLTPEWVKDTLGTGRGFVTLIGLGAQVDHVNYVSTGGSVGIKIQSSVKYASLRDCYLEGCGEAIINEGEFVTLERVHIKDSIRNDVIDSGGMVGEEHELPINPYMPQGIGSFDVVVSDPNHGGTTGNNVRFSGSVNGHPPPYAGQDNGLYIKPSNAVDSAYDITFLTSDTYRITLSEGSTGYKPPEGTSEILAFGGTTCVSRWTSGDHYTQHNTYIAVTCEHTVPNACVAFSVGANVAPYGLSKNATFFLCKQIGAAIPKQDRGENTRWIECEGVPGAKNVKADYLSSPRLETDTWGDPIEVIPFNPAFASTLIPITGLDRFRAVRVEASDLTFSGTINPAYFGVSSDNGATALLTTAGTYRRFGMIGGSERYIWSGNTTLPFGGTIEIEDFNQPIQSFVRSRGGGHDEPASRVVAGGYIIPPEKWSGLFIQLSGVQTGGTIWVYGKE